MSTTAEADIQALFAAYGEALGRADAAAVAALFAFPATIRQGTAARIFADAATLAREVDALIDVFDEAGIASNVPQVSKIEVAGYAAIARVDWTQAEEAGAVLNRFAALYSLVREAGAWRITAMVESGADAG